MNTHGSGCAYCTCLTAVLHRTTSQGLQFTFGDTLRKFAEPGGITFTTTASSGHGTQTVAFQGFLLVISGDTLAVAELIGFKRGFSSKVHSPCWQCNCKGMPTQPTHRQCPQSPSCKSSWRANQALVFVLTGSELKKLDGFTNRSAEEYNAQQERAEHLPVNEPTRPKEKGKQKRKRHDDDDDNDPHHGQITRQQYMSSLGINTFDHAYKGIYWPCVVHVPRDLMHVELEGTLKSHLLGVLYMAMRKLKWFTLGQFNKALKEWPFPHGKRPDILPEVPKGIF